MQTTTNRAEESADKVINNIRRYLREGLPGCYPSFKDYICDFWPDLPWTDSELLHATKYILATYPQVVDDVLIKFGFNFRPELEEAVIAMEKEKE